MIQVGDVMRACRNFFPVSFTQGAWTLAEGRMAPAIDAQPGDWIAVSGSMRNNGVFQLNEEGRIPGATDESFYGSVWRLAPPADFLRLCEEIAAYDQAHPASTVTAERFGQYSATHAPGGWEAAFSTRLNGFRRMFPEVHV